MSILNGGGFSVLVNNFKLNVHYGFIMGVTPPLGGMTATVPALVEPPHFSSHRAAHRVGERLCPAIKQQEMILTPSVCHRLLTPEEAGDPRGETAPRVFDVEVHSKRVLCTSPRKVQRQCVLHPVFR